MIASLANSVWVEYLQFNAEQASVFFLIAGGFMFLNALIMTPPSEYVCLVAGIALANNEHGIVFFVLVASMANLAGTLPYYFLGYFHHHRSIDIYAPPSKKQRMLRLFYRYYIAILPSIEAEYQKRGPMLVFLLRNIPVIRSIASYPAGRVRMKFALFFIFSLAGILLWVSVWTFSGAIFGEMAIRYSSPITVGIFLVFLFLIRRVLKHLKARSTGSQY